MEIEAEDHSDTISPRDFEKYVLHLKLSDYGFRLEIDINEVLDDIIHKIRTVTEGKDQSLLLQFDTFSTDWWTTILERICSSNEIMSRIDDLDFQDTEFRFKDLADLFELYSISANPKQWPFINIHLTQAYMIASEDFIKNLKKEIDGRSYPEEVMMVKELWQLEGPYRHNGMEAGEVDTEENKDKKKGEETMIEFAKLAYFAKNPFIQDQLAAMKII